MVYTHATIDRAGLLGQGSQTLVAQVVCRAAALQTYAAATVEAGNAAKGVTAVTRAWDFN